MSPLGRDPNQHKTAVGWTHHSQTGVHEVNDEAIASWVHIHRSAWCPCKPYWLPTPQTPHCLEGLVAKRITQVGPAVHAIGGRWLGWA